MWPLWTYIVLLAVGIVVSIVRAVAQFQQMLP
jgi:type III secretory pathway component EscS